MDFSTERKSISAEEFRVRWNRGAAIVDSKKIANGDYFIDYVFPDARCRWTIKIEAAEAEKLADLLPK